MNPPEKKPEEGLLPSPFVTSVTSVPLEEKNKSNHSNKGNKEHNYISLVSDGFLAGKNEQLKAAIYLYDHPEGLSRLEISEVAKISPDTLKVYLDRLNKNGWLTIINPKPYRYLLTELGRAEIEKLYATYRQVTSERESQKVRAQETTPSYETEMDLSTQIAKFQEFFAVNEEYMQQLLEQTRLGNGWITAVYHDLSRFSPELAELLLERPDEVLKAWQIAIEKMDLPTADNSEPPQIRVRITKLPDTVRLSSLGPEHINHLIQVEAQVLTVSERRPMVMSARFECPSCGNVLYVLQADQRFREPTKCGCGRKGKFLLLSKELVPACSLLLVQPLTELVGKKVKPSQLKVFLKNDLTRDDVRDHLGLNSMVRVNGVVHEVPIMLREGGQSTRFDLVIEAVSVELMDHYNPQLALSPERIEQIKKDVASPRFKERMIESFFPRHVGEDNLKLQFLCMSVAMPLHLNSAEAKRQAACEALHIIVAGDPGMGKSTTLGNRVLELVPHSGRATGAGASKAGLTIAADSKDKENDLVIPQPGAIPSANMGIFLLDELDKMELNEQTVLNEALSEHTVTITKRGVNLCLPAMECFIGFANPRMKTWDLSKQSIQNELNIHYSLLTRCIINVQADVAEEARDLLIARAVLNKDQTVLTPFDDQYIRDYLLYVRGTVHPKIREKDKEMIADMYAKLRKILPLKALCPRFVEQVRSLSLLHAKIYLRDETKKEDIEFARDILLRSLATSGYESAALNVKEERVGSIRDDIIAHVRSHPLGVKLVDLYAKFPDADIQRMIERGDLTESKSGIIRVLE